VAQSFPLQSRKNSSRIAENLDWKKSWVGGIMTKKALAGLALGAGLVALLAVLYAFYPGGAPQVSPGKPESPAGVPYRTAPEFAGKPPTPGPGAPPAQETPAAPLGKAAPPLAETPAPPEPKLPAAPPPVPEEHYGLLVGRYRTYKEADKVKEKLQKEGKPAFIRHDGGQRRPYAVWAGPFPNQEQSKVAAKAIKAKMKVSPKLEKLQIPVPK
jgi:cell division septation protein DedD